VQGVFVIINVVGLVWYGKLRRELRALPEFVVKDNARSSKATTGAFLLEEGAWAGMQKKQQHVHVYLC